MKFYETVKMVRKLLLIFLAFIFHVSLYPINAQDVKTWRSNLNFNNPLNWKNGQVPCSKQKIVFPASPSYAVFMPESLTVSEMILPRDGELVFPTNAIFNIADNTLDDNCIKTEAEFLVEKYFWYDPKNWNITSNRMFPRRVSTQNSAVPHAYRIPCLMDEAWFPVDTTFRVHVIYPITKLSKIIIGFKEYGENGENFNNFIRTTTGKMLFPDVPTITLSNAKCNDVTGCICGNENQDVLPTICKFTIPCPELACSDPVTPVGHCCPVCASIISIHYGPNFRMDRLMQFYDNFLSKELFSNVESFTSKTSNGKIQSVFVDSTLRNEKANRVSQQIHDAVFADVIGARTYGIQSVGIVKSEIWSSDGVKYDKYSSGISSGGVAAIIVLVILIVSLAIAFYIYKKKQIPGFSFARFDLRGDKIELELGTTPHEALEPEEGSNSHKTEEKDRSFDNPIYGTNVAATEVVSEGEDSLEGKDFVENPMFMIFEDSTKKD